MGNYTILYMFENPRRGRQASNFTTNVPKILDLKSSSEQIFSQNCRWVPLTYEGSVGVWGTWSRGYFASVPKNRVDRYARDSETFENSEVIVGWMAIKRSGNKTATEIKVTRPSFLGGVPSYFEALWYPHLYFYRKSNIEWITYRLIYNIT